PTCWCFRTDTFSCRMPQLLPPRRLRVNLTGIRCKWVSHDWQGKWPADWQAFEIHLPSAVAKTNPKPSFLDVIPGGRSVTFPPIRHGPSRTTRPPCWGHFEALFTLDSAGLAGFRLGSSRHCIPSNVAVPDARLFFMTQTELQSGQQDSQ